HPRRCAGRCEQHQGGDCRPADAARRGRGEPAARLGADRRDQPQMALRARHEVEAAMRLWLLLPIAFLSACGGGRVPPDWELHSYAALGAFQAHYLAGDTRTADLDFKRLKDELSATGRPGLIARAELLRCALRTAALEIDECPAFDRGDAGPEELAYMGYL